jgi:hypothetical protein
MPHLTESVEGLDLRDRERTYAELRSRIESRWRDGGTPFSVFRELGQEIGLASTPWTWEIQSAVADHLYRRFA